jgi:branched-subunit amino acid aminotransferase/4-amino-4-deoxychorismate lyase
MVVFCFVNGVKTAEGEHSLSVDDLGLQRGYAVFDYARTYHGKLFHPRDHLDRLERSAAALHLAMPCAKDELIRQAEELVAECGLERPAVRFLVTGGEVAGCERPTVVVSVEELPRHPENLYTEGGTLMTYEFQRELPEVKTTNYMNALRLDPMRRERGACEILYHRGGRITECARSSFFLFEEDTLVTPGEEVLLGVTRGVVLRLARERFEVEERPIELTELGRASEAFITATSKGVMPIVRVDELVIGDGVPGPRTRWIMERFARHTESFGER